MILTGFNTSNSDKYTNNEREQEYNSNMDIITEQGRIDVLKRISELRKRKPDISERISAARDQGGLEENEELHMALEEMQRVDYDINRLNGILEKCVEINIPPAGEYEIAKPGMWVEIENLETERVVTYQLLGEVESDPSKGILSIQSPLGRELLNSKVGDVAEIERGADIIEWEVLRIFSKKS